MKNLYLLFIVGLALAAGAFAQSNGPTPEAKKAEMRKLDKLVGQWHGSGWIQQGRDRETFTGTENVQKKLDGLATLVEGNFTNSEGKIVHQTLAILSAKDDISGYNFATYLANGITGTQDLRLVGDHFEWGFKIPQGTIRYTIRVDGKTWSEIGEFSRDGQTWMKTFEMKLDRVGPAH